MGKVLLYLWALAAICLGVMITFKALKFFCRRSKNDTFKKWVAPIISGLLGGCFIVGAPMVAFLIYQDVGFLREFIDAIGSL